MHAASLQIISVSATTGIDVCAKQTGRHVQEPSISLWKKSKYVQVSAQVLGP